MKKWWFYLFLLFGVDALADDARPILLELSDAGKNNYRVMFKVPNNVRLRDVPELVFPGDCNQRTLGGTTQRDGVISHLVISCDQSLRGRPLSMAYASYNPGMFLLFRFIDGEQRQSAQLLNPEQTQWLVPKQLSSGVVLQEYTVLGVEHIWAGWDHLLFVACLIFLTAGRWQKLLWAVSGFTIAHSLTLMLASLQLVTLPLPPVEAVIALSILFLATEITRRDHRSLSYRFPVLVSSSFGLLHGFGFASVLMDVGLPEGDITMALLGFNLGVELGQLAFIALCLLLLALYNRLFSQNLSALLLQPNGHGGAAGFYLMIYVVGGTSAYWTIERLAAFL